MTFLKHMLCPLSNPTAKHLRTTARFDFFKFDYEHANKSRVLWRRQNYAKTGSRGSTRSQQAAPSKKIPPIAMMGAFQSP